MRLDYHAYDDLIMTALRDAGTAELCRYGSEASLVILLAKSARLIRKRLPYASDGLMRRTARLMKQLQ